MISIPKSSRNLSSYRQGPTIQEALILESDQSREALRQGITLLSNPNLTRQQYLNHQFNQLSLSLSSSLTHGRQYSRTNQSYRSVNQNQKTTASASQCQERPINGSELSTTPLIAVSQKKYKNWLKKRHLKEGLCYLLLFKRKYRYS